MLLKISHHTYRSLWLLGLVFVLLVAAYLSAGRYFTSRIHQYEGWLSNQIAAATGLDVQLTGMWGEWRGITPRIGFSSLSLIDRNDRQVVLSVHNGELEAAPLRSLFLLHPEINHISVSALQLRLRQLEDYRWHLPGTAVPARRNSPLILPNWLVDSFLSMDHMLAHEIAVALEFNNGQRSAFTGSGVGLESDGYFRRLKAGLNCAGCGASAVVYEGFGDPRDRDYIGRGYIEVNRFQSGMLAGLVPPQYQPLFSRDVSGRLWLHARDAHTFEVVADLDVPELGLGSIWYHPERDLNDGYVKLSASGGLELNDWQMHIEQIRGRWQGNDLDYGGIGVLFRRDLFQLDIQLAELDAGVLASQLGMGPSVPEQLKTVLSELAPKGRLLNLLIELPLRRDELVSGLRLEAELDEVSISAWKGVPGFDAVTGYVSTGLAGGSILVDGDNLALDLPYVYEQPLQLDAAIGQVDWHRSEQSIALQSGLLRFSSHGSPGRALLDLNLPLKREFGAPEMGLQIAVSDIGVEHRDHYIPKLIPDDLDKWLSESILGGHAREAAYLYRGSLAKDDNDARTSQLFIDIENGSLRYHPDWPPVHSVDALLHLDDIALTVHSSKAGIFDAIELADATAVIESEQGGKKSVLKLQAKADATVQDALRLVNESALRKAVGNTFAEWQGSGEVDATLDLSIPLYKGGVPQVEVAADIDSRRMLIKDLNLAVTDIQGRLNYGRDGVSAQALQARLFGKPFRVDISQQGSQVATRASGQVAASDLQSWLNLPWFAYLEGSSQVDLEILAGGASGGELTARSELLGTRVLLPQTLAKAADQAAQLSLRIPLQSGETVWDISIAGLLEMALRMQGGDMQSLLLRATEGGAGGRRALPESGILVDGALSAFELEQWLDFLRGLAVAGGAAGGNSQFLPVRVEGLSIRDSRVLGQAMGSVVVAVDNGKRRGDPWQVRFAGQQVNGEVVMPTDDDTPIRVMLGEVRLAALNSGGDSGEQSLLDGIDPLSLPLLDVDVDALVIGEELWGDIGFSMQRENEALLLDNIRGAIRGIRLNPDQGRTALRWSRQNGGQVTSVMGRIAIPDLGAALERWGYTRVIEGEGGSFAVDMNWPDYPDNFSLNTAEGSVIIDVDSGRIPNSAQQAEGALKVVGILNLSLILRRLQFDFKDVYQKGVHFDDIDGELRLSRGMISLSEPLEIDGPSSRFVITGDLDCFSEQVAMELVATLPVGSNLPWVAALVGGLPAAAGMFVASKVFEKQLDQASSAVYVIQGDWADPEVKFKKLFDVEGGGNSRPGSPRTGPSPGGGGG